MYYFTAFSLRFDNSVGRVSVLGFGILYQQELIPNLVFCICCVHTNRSWIQRWLTHWHVLALKLLVLFPNFKLGFIVMFMVWPRLTHSYQCCFTKNMIRHAPMGTIFRPLYSSGGVTEATAFIKWVNGREPHIHELWFLGLDGIRCKFHPTAHVDFTAQIVGEVCDRLTCWKLTHNRYHQATFRKRQRQIFGCAQPIHRKWISIYLQPYGSRWSHRVDFWQQFQSGMGREFQLRLQHDKFCLVWLRWPLLGLLTMGSC